MATTQTLAELRTAAKTRANMQNSSFVSDAEWTTLINSAGFALYDILVASYGDDYFETNGTITTDGTDRIALPTTLYKLTGVEILLGGSGESAQYQTLQRFSKADRNSHTYPGAPLAGNWSTLRYRVSGSYLWLSPIATSGQTLRLWFVPRWVPLSAEADTFDGISGWSDYIVADAARKALLMEESDTSGIERDLADLKQRIVSMAPNRDEGPTTVAEGANGGWSHGGGW